MMANLTLPAATASYDLFSAVMVDVVVDWLFLQKLYGNNKIVHGFTK